MPLRFNLLSLEEHLKLCCKSKTRNYYYETVIHRIVHSDTVSLSHIRPEQTESTKYTCWFSMLLLLSLFSFLFLVKNTFGVKEGRLCGGNCLFACAHVVAYGTKNPSGLKEGRKFWHSVAMWSFWNKQVLVIERVAWKII